MLLDWNESQPATPACILVFQGVDPPALFKGHAKPAQIVALTSIQAEGLFIDPTAGETLSASETELARLLVRGLSNRSIADRLSIGERTVVRRISALRSRLGVPTKAELVAKLRQRSLDAD